MATDLRPDQSTQLYHNVYGGQKMLVNKVIRAGQISTVNRTIMAAQQMAIQHELLSTSVANHIYVARTITRVTGASYIPRVVGSESAPTLMLDKTDGGGTAPGAGDDILSGAMAMKGTADTVVNAGLHATDGNAILAVGDTIGITFPGDSLTAVVGNLTVELEVVAGAIDQIIFTAATISRVKSIKYTPLVAGTDSGTVTLMVDRCQGVEAPGSGDNLLTSTGFNLKSTIHTVQTGTLTTTDAERILAVGDRLAIDVTGSLTDVAGVLSIEIESMADAIDSLIYTAQRICKVTAITYTPLVAGTDSGTVTLMVDRCQDTEAPGAGDNLMTGTFNLKSSIHTVQEGTLSGTAAHLVLEIGDRLAVDLTGSLTDVSGVLTVEVEMMKQDDSMP